MLDGITSHAFICTPPTDDQHHKRGMSSFTVRHFNCQGFVLLLSAIVLRRQGIGCVYAEAASFRLQCVEPEGCNKTANSLSFFVVGDYGGIPKCPYYNKQQKRVAAEMAKLANQHPVDFVLGIGDNFYDSGVKSVNSKRFQTTFENVYKNNSLQVPWYVMAGNHDHKGNVKAQVEYTNYSHRWTFPNNYFGIKYNLEDSLQVEILVIDTVDLCGQTSDEIPNSFLEISTVPEAAQQRQWSWLESRLQTSQAEYLFVSGHYPVWSVGSHGPTSCLVERLDRLLKKHDATAYICGHDHNLQHLQVLSQGSAMNYILSGLASKTDERVNHLASVPAGSLKFLFPKHKNFIVDVLKLQTGGFVLIGLSTDGGHAKYYDGDGNQLYQFNFKARASRSGVQPATPAKETKLVGVRAENVDFR